MCYFVGTNVLLCNHLIYKCEVFGVMVLYKRFVFLCCTEFRNLAAPDKPSEKTFGAIVTLVRDHHNPPPSAIVQRFKFHSRSQKDGESIAEFVAELRRLSEHCRFDDTLDAMLRDRVVCGVRDVRVQRTLLAKPDLTFKVAFQNAKDLQAPAGSETVHAVTTNRSSSHLSTNKASPTRTGECYRCGGKQGASTCRFREAECFVCGEKGHLARMCARRREWSRAKEDTQEHWLAVHKEERQNCTSWRLV